MAYVLVKDFEPLLIDVRIGLGVPRLLFASDVRPAFAQSVLLNLVVLLCNTVYNSVLVFAV